MVLALGGLGAARGVYLGGDVLALCERTAFGISAMITALKGGYLGRPLG